MRTRNFVRFASNPVLPALVLALLAGCTTRVVHQTVEKRQTTAPAPRSDKERQNLEALLGSSLFPSFQGFFSHSAVPLSQRSIDTLSAAMVTRTLNALQNPGSNPCPHLKKSSSEWFHCLTAHALTYDLVESDEVERLAAQYYAAQGEPYPSRPFLSSDEKLDRQSLEGALASLRSKQTLSELAASLQNSTTKLATLVEKISEPGRNSDAPYISEDFFEGRSFLFSYGLEHSSLRGGSALPESANIGSTLVRIEVKSGLFNLMERVNNPSITEAPIASYPILDIRDVDGKRFFQVDFSAPTGGAIRWSGSIYSLAELKEDPGITIRPAIILPKLLHQAKAPRAGLNPKADHFTAADNAIVVEELMVLERAIPGNEPTEDDLNQGRTALRPVVRVVTALTAIDDSSREFARTQAVDPFAARENLRIRLNYESAENELPFLLAGRKQIVGESEQSGYRASKFNLSRPIVFVMSANTPKAFIPAIRSAVLSYQNLFATLGRPAPTITTQTEAEFLAANPSIPSPLRATDPRVNLVVWDDSPDTGAVWSTSVRNPSSGEVISADIHLPGTLWAREGCITFLHRTWSRSRKEPVVPSRKTRGDWIRSCDQVAAELSEKSPVETSAGINPGAAPQPLPHDSALQHAGRAPSTVSLFSQGEDSISVESGAPSIVNAPSLLDPLILADWGAPAVNSELLKEPRQAAIAAIRAAMLHELGHTFGLRHNFLGSGLSAQLSPHVPPPLPLFDRTDSIMDYNDPAIELDLGAMPDTNDAESAVRQPTFGAYDVLALAELYRLDASGFRFTRRPGFCTDGDNSVGNTCKPFDYGLIRKGHEYGEYLLHRLNMKAIELASITDAMEVLAFDWNSMKDLLSQVAEVWGNWQDVHDESRIEFADMLFDPNAWQQQPEHKFTNSFLDVLKPRYDLLRLFGLGTPFLVNVDSDFPGKDPILVDTGLQMLRTAAMQVINVENKRLLAMRADPARDIPLEIANLPAIDLRYRDVLLEAFAGEAILPAGRRVLALFFDSNAVFSQFVTLKEPFLNHHANNSDIVETVTLPNGNVKTLTGKVAGHYDTAELMNFVEAAAFVAPGTREWRSSPPRPGASVTRLKNDRDVLRKLSETTQIPLISNSTSLLLDKYQSLIDSIDRNQISR
jgi:hypothetical protein